MNTVLRKLCALLCVFVLLGVTAVVAETAQTAEETQYRNCKKAIRDRMCWRSSNACTIWVTSTR